MTTTEQTQHGFPAQARLHNGREYGRVFYQQQKAAGSWTVVLVCPRRPWEAQQPRLGIIVSRKVHKHAVRRHQLKRWVREWFRQQASKRISAYDLVVLFLRDPPADAHALLDAELNRLLDKALLAQPQPGSARRRGRGRK